LRTRSWRSKNPELCQNYESAVALRAMPRILAAQLRKAAA
jgi:hypothetical protein